MTAPITVADSIASPQQPAAETLDFPISWLLDNAAPAIAYRAATEVARLPEDIVRKLEWLPYSYRPALRLALSQQMDGTWNKAMLSTPSRQSTDFAGVGTINAFRRLIEYGWAADSPPLVAARRILFRLLAEDTDPQFLFELAVKAKGEDAVRHGRNILREAAAAALAQAGYEADPRLRGAARRILERVAAFVDSPLAQKPWTRIGNVHALAAEAMPPSIYVLSMLAHMPIFRQENYVVMERIYDWVSQPLPRQESVQVVGGKIVEQPHLILGDRLPHRNAVDADIPFSLMWLELMARLNFLRRNENWSRMFERFVDDRDRGVWHPHKGTSIPGTSNPRVWPMFPLEELTSGVSKASAAPWADVTFRIGLIGRLSGRQIEPI